MTESKQKPPKFNHFEGLEWYDAKTEWPELEKEVLGFWTLPRNNPRIERVNQPDKLLEVYEIILCDSLTITKKGTSSHWRDHEFNTKVPLFWCYLPKSPITFKP